MASCVGRLARKAEIVIGAARIWHAAGAMRMSWLVKATYRPSARELEVSARTSASLRLPQRKKLVAARARTAAKASHQNSAEQDFTATWEQAFA